MSDGGGHPAAALDGIERLEQTRNETEAPPNLWSPAMTMMRGVRPSLRAACLLVCWSVGIVAQISAAQAECRRIYERGPLTEGQAKQKIEEYLTARYEVSDFGVFQMTSRYYIARTVSADCEDVCQYLLLEFRDGNVVEKFVFDGTGEFWIVVSPQLAHYILQFNDFYFTVLVQSPERAFVRISVPRGHNPVLIAASPDDRLIPLCDK